MTGLISYELVPFGWPVIIYFTLAGVACGTCLAGCLILWSNDALYHQLGKRALWVATLAIAAGAMALVSDLEAPQRFWLILTQLNGHSVIAWGARLITVFGCLCGYVAVTTQVPSEISPVPRRLLALLVLLALGVGMYPAYVLGQATARPLWGAPVLAPLWLVSGMHLGLGALLLLSVLAPPQASAGCNGLASAHLRIFNRLDVWLILLEAALLAAYLSLLTGASQRAVARLVTGGMSAWLWIGVILVGWGVPLLEIARGDGGRRGLAVRSTCLLLGGLSIRTLIVLGGQGAGAFLGA
ncbi:MAG: NrfD/PsrC family molybdoenzyme membrane anchor subunit [Candidatus Binatia bacterium]